MTTASPKPARGDGAEARQRLLLAALALFADQGFAKTSTRAIAAAADMNIGAISYYFGDKAGLYAACFTEPLGGTAEETTALWSAPGLSLGEALAVFMTAYLAPLKLGEPVRQCMRLHLREMLEPSSQWATEVERDIKAPHQAMVRLLARHLGARVDDDIHRLAFAVIGLAMQPYVTRDFIDAIRPGLLRGPRAVDQWAERLAGMAQALVGAERSRRAATVSEEAST
ncbi:CerR family C-terminal domain-containing protein [Pseudacidovorax intermedius]|uniref:TetR family transcriptional regulator n=1 Tax=Pseudacidovorax intermedius TaxID=433924 RepID=A0A147GP64_9BURK|nr:CerR family C-terminal domain-containing protein [Pseudacidovorax intermedius]KTT15671.1 TetR family transcriptional regulator [Pseudacidovorax intermedius]